MMAHQNPEESIETSSDFMTFQMESSSIEVSEESDKVDVHRFLADQNKMKDFISCRTCKQEFDHVSHKPFLLPCLDAICKNCLQEISKSQSYECVKCRCSHTCFQNDKVLLQIDNTREIASEVFRLKIGGSSMVCGMCTNDQMASHRCFDCSVFICEDCVKLHLSLKTLKSHSFLEIKCLLTGKIKNLGLSYAPKHCPVAGHEKEQIKMHCLDPSCLKNVCVLCAISTHKDHNLCDITKVEKEMETKIETYLKSINLKVQQANTSIVQLSDINENCQKDSQQLQMEIRTCFSEARKALEKREKDLCDAVALYSKEKQVCIQSEKKKISSFISSCNEARYYGKVSSEVNDHNHFVDIANIILPQLEILDSQLPEIEVTVDTMTFSSQLRESCFKTAVNNLGKLLLSKVYPPKSKVVVSPPVCYVGQQIKFKIQLFSSTGNLIVNEDVSVNLKVNGKTYQLLKCAFETSSTSFTGLWVPDMPMKISWIVFSNDVEFQTLNGVIDVRKPDIIITADEWKEGKASMSGKQNKRAGRTFAKTETPEKAPKGAGSSINVYRGDVYAEKISKYTSQQQKKLEIKTKEGLRIKIYADSITRLTVDCIVNAANENLMHGGGVAAAISEAAGYQFDQESRYYVQQNGPIPVGTCCVTSAGKLPYKCVIHTVGPRWIDYKDKNLCLQDLQESVEVTFRKANEMGMKSIAIPAISSGIFAVPMKNCVEEYYKAAMSFSRSYPFKNLQEIHFVDRDESMVRAIQEIFQPKKPFKCTLDKSGNPDKEKDRPADGAKYSFQSVMPDSNSYTIVHVSENFQIKIHLGKVTDVPADAIVCPQDEYLSSKDDIAVEIFKKLSCEPKYSNKKLNHGEISSQSLHGNSPWKLIIHAVAPRYDSNYAKDALEFGRVLNTMIQKIIEAADGANNGSVAIPLLGAGKGDYKTPVDLCASNFLKAVLNSIFKVASLKDIYLVLDDEVIEKMYLDAFKYHDFKTTPRAESKVGNSKSNQSFGKMLTSLSKDEENCCICTNELTNPKRLKRCGHIFCKECIEQSFQYKPVCPSCGQIYGKMTGDQPLGSIMIQSDYQQKLKGFSDSTGCIILTYTFQSGRQGIEHPEPGKWYQGISRFGYVPNNEKGRLVAKLLNVAFSRRLVFTIGQSRTTGEKGVITWNDIYHKTRPDGGPERCGYPDPTYLDRVLEELEAKGVTEESADDPEEYKEYTEHIQKKLNRCRVN